MKLTNYDTSLKGIHVLTIKGIVCKLTVKFWMYEKCGKMKDHNKKMNTDTVE
jgi:hypothetical protein